MNDCPNKNLSLIVGCPIFSNDFPTKKRHFQFDMLPRTALPGVFSEPLACISAVRWKEVWGCDIYLYWLVVWTPLKNISQLYGTLKNVPNHQPVIHLSRKEMSKSWAPGNLVKKKTSVPTILETHGNGIFWGCYIGIKWCDNSHWQLGLVWLNYGWCIGHPINRV